MTLSSVVFQTSGWMDAPGHFYPLVISPTGTFTGTFISSAAVGTCVPPAKASLCHIPALLLLFVVVYLHALRQIRLTLEDVYSISQLLFLRSDRRRQIRY